MILLLDSRIVSICNNGVSLFCRFSFILRPIFPNAMFPCITTNAFVLECLENP